MRIGIAIYNFNPKKGGAERYAFDLSHYLSMRGHEVFVFCSRGLRIPGMNVIRFNTMPFPRWLRALSFAIKHSKYVKFFNLDIMLGFGNTLAVNVHQSHGGVQKIWMEREITSYDNPYERKIKAFFLKSSFHQKIQELIAEYPIRTNKELRIIAISDMVKEHMIKHYNLSENTIDVVYNGVDTERFKPAHVKTDGILKILFSAGNFRLKGLSPLLAAVGEISKERKDFHLYVMGRGRKKRYYKLIDDLKIRDFVTFLGEVSSPESVYKDSHILVHPTFYDACSLTTMESMAAGLPTITTRWNGASALITNDNGFVMDEPRNIPSLCGTIKSLFDREKRGHMGKNARKTLEHYTIERNAEQMEHIFLEVCDGK